MNGFANDQGTLAFINSIQIRGKGMKRFPFGIAASVAIIIFASTMVDDASAQRGSRPRGGAGKSAAGKTTAKKSSIKPYEEVITKEAKTKKGLFVTHQIDEKFYFEIPTDQLNKDMLWVTQISKTQAGSSYAGMPVGDRVVRWELRGKQVLLRDIKYSIRADVKGSIKLAVESTNVAPIIKAFPVACWGTDKKPVIDVTSLFTSDVTEFSAKRALNASSMDSRRSYFEEIKSFPENVDVKVLATYNVSSSTSGAGPRRGGATRRDPTQSSITAVIHHSMLALPEKPMTPRVFDDRVGFFTVRFQDFGNFGNHQVEEVRYITRWRLEKKDPKAKVSEPVKPIVFYVGRGVPDKWKPYVKQGIEMWQPAFEAAGFKNAIIGKMAPTEQEDPEWDAEDARVSTIRWLPSTTENAFGPHVHDPRTGEILEADVRIYHNVLKLVRDWYFVQAAASDKRAQQLPMPDDLIGELLAYVVAHEVGHSIGFPHNMKASAAFSVEQLRDPEWTKKWGTEASIMDYGRFNYVAQPEDGAHLIPKLGPYDFFAVDWGYSQYANEREEKKALDALLAKQKSDPMLRFGSADPSEDPTRQTEDLGSDTIEATELGMKNIDRIADFLVKACCKEGQDYELLKNMYEQLIRQRARELSHVTAMVGGFESINLYFGDADRRFHPIDGDKQRKAVQLLIKHGFTTNPKLVDPAITRRLEANGAANRILSSQKSILRSLISKDRVERMSEHVVTSEGTQNIYTPAQMLEDVRAGIWTDIGNAKAKVDLYQRNLQRAHVEVLASRIKSTSDKSDLPSLVRAQLKAIRALAQAKLDARRKELTVSTDGSKITVANDMTTAHLEQIIADIDAALDPQVGQGGSSTPTPTFGRRR